MSSTLAERPLASPTADSPATAVLHLINGEHFSGAERVQDLLAGALPRFGYSLGFACLKPGLFASHRQHRESALMTTEMRSRFDVSVAKQIAEFARRGSYRLLHAHTPRSLMIGCQVARRTGLPLVYHVHSPAGRDSTRTWWNRFNLWLETRNLQRAARLICVSSSIAYYMSRHGHSIEKIRVVPNGVPQQAFLQRNRPAGQWTIGTIALFRPRKGVEVLLEALALTKRQGLSAKLLAVGPFESDEYERQVRQRVEKLGIEELVQWTGFCHDVDARLREMDAFVLPSLFGEGLPMVVLEAMAIGLPVIASDVEGIPEAIRDGQDGLLFAAGDAQDLHARIDDLTRGRCDWSAMRQSAWNRQRKCFSDVILAEKIARVYDELLQQ